MFSLVTGLRLICYLSVIGGQRPVRRLMRGQSIRGRADEFSFAVSPSRSPTSYGDAFCEVSWPTAASCPRRMSFSSSSRSSKPSLREAMRILEAEGLLRVRRGKLGGAVVRRPNAANVAYTVGLVLGSRRWAFRRRQRPTSGRAGVRGAVRPACRSWPRRGPAAATDACRRRRGRRGPAAGDIGKPAVP